MSLIHPSTKRYATLLVLLVVCFSLTLMGCSSLSSTEKGAATGAGAGAVVGGAVAKATGNSTAKGAILGAVIGGTAGAIIGQQMDKQAEELEDDLEDADVERVGEGIIVTFDSGILFDFDSAALRSEARANLRDFAESLEDYENTEVLIVGHTDAVGDADYNYDLSQRRAQAAAQYLRSLGVSSARVETTGRGETEPVATNDTDYGRQQNRRVEVAIFASEEYREEVASSR